jgi:predicted NAD/FAD-binding protein
VPWRHFLSASIRKKGEFVKNRLKSLACLGIALLWGNISLAAKPRVAVLGAGGAGVATAWLLEENYDVTLIESSRRLGGHANTINVSFPHDAKYAGKTFPIDAGFEFITRAEFPNFMRYLEILGVDVDPFQLTTSFFSEESKEGYVVTPFSKGSIAWSTLLNPCTIYKLLSLKKVMNAGREFIKGALLSDSVRLEKPLSAFLDGLNLNGDVAQKFVYPLLSAGWGVPREEFKHYSAFQVFSTIVTESNGYDAPTWYEIRGGTGAYIRAAAAQLRETTFLLSTKIVEIKREGKIYHLKTSAGKIEDFDYVVIGTPLNQMELLLAGLPEYRNFVSAVSRVRYYQTHIYLHGDTSFMPKDRSKWSVMNVRSIHEGEKSGFTAYKAWHSPAEYPVFKSWVYPDERKPEKIYGEAHFDHPHLDIHYVRAQREIAAYQGKNNLYLVGVHTQDTNRHESAINSAIAVAKKLAPQSGRMRQLSVLK